MVKSTIVKKFTPKDKLFLLAFEAVQLNNFLVNHRERAYGAQDYGLATRLETLANKSHKRLNRRYNDFHYATGGIV